MDPRWHSEKESACQCRRQQIQVQSLGLEDPLEEEMTTHSSIFAWIILWTEELVGTITHGVEKSQIQLRMHVVTVSYLLQYDPYSSF